MRRLHGALLCCIAVSSGGVSSAATLKVPGQHATIADAVDAAENGDTIKISKGRYQETVTTTKSLHFVGEKGTIWDGFTGAFHADQLTVTGDDVSVKEILFENGSYPVTIVGDNANVTHCRFRGTSDGIAILGDNGSVTNNLFQGQQLSSNPTIHISGAGAYVFKNTIEEGRSGAIVIFAENGTAIVCKNTITTMDDDALIFIEGSSSAQVIKNTITNCASAYRCIELFECENSEVIGNKIKTIHDSTSVAIYLHGGAGNLVSNNYISNMYADNEIFLIHISEDNVTISNNLIVACLAGYDYDTTAIRVIGNNAVIEKNQINDMGGSGETTYGIRLSGNDSVITKNKIDGINDIRTQGIVSSGDRNTISNNDVLHLMSEFGIMATGTDFVVRDNMVKNGASGCLGIYVSGSASEPGALVIEGNTVSKVAHRGFVIECTDGIIRNNTAKHTSGYGFAVSGSNNEFSNNVANNTYDDGFHVTGSSNLFFQCEARDSYRDGFDIDGTANVLDECAAYDCVAEGVDNGDGVGTTVTGCILTNSRIDYAGASQVTDDTGTVFTIGGATALPEID